DDGTTMLTTFVFTKSRYPGPAGRMRAVRRLLRRKIDHEIRLDMRILEGLADQRADIEGMTLSRFDKVLALNRERINRIYRGLKPEQRDVYRNGAIFDAVPGNCQGEGDRS